MVKTLKRAGSILLSTVLIITTISLPANAAPTNDEKSIATMIFNLTNEERTKNGVPKLQRNIELDVVAYNWSNHLVKVNKMYHNPNNGEQYPAGWTYRGENVGGPWCTAKSNSQIAKDFVNAWMNSPAHRSSILEPGFNMIGVGVANKGNCYAVTQNFAHYPNYTPPPPAPKPAPKPKVKNYFIDVNQNASKGSKNYSQFAKEINWAGKTGVANGWTTSKGQEFRPKANMKRDAMAAFLYRQYGKGDKVDMNVLKNVKDVNSNTPHAKAIAWMYQKRITTGYADGTFKPQSSVNRDSLAAFLYRVAVMQGDPSTKNVKTGPTVKKFKDVNSNTKFLREIAWMNNERITTGYSNGTYRPNNPISREAMITFIYRLNT